MQKRMEGTKAEAREMRDGLIAERDHEAADLLGSLVAGQPGDGGRDDALTSVNPAKSPENDAKTVPEKMSPLCLQQRKSKAKKKQANRLKKAS